MLSHLLLYASILYGGLFFSYKSSKNNVIISHYDNLSKGVSIDKNTIFFNGYVNKENADQIIKFIEHINYNTNYNEIYLHVNSPGGSLYDGFDVAKSVLLSPIPVYTISNSHASSAASLIYSGGKARYINKQKGYVLIHQCFTPLNGCNIDVGYYDLVNELQKNTTMNLFCNREKRQENNTLCCVELSHGEMVELKDDLKTSINIMKNFYHSMSRKTIPNEELDYIFKNDFKLNYNTTASYGLAEGLYIKMNLYTAKKLGINYLVFNYDTQKIDTILSILIWPFIWLMDLVEQFIY